MKPPMCSICRKKFRPSSSESGGVYFALTEEEQAKKEERRRKRIIGHPIGYHWFCKEHYAKAKTLKHLLWKDARPQI